MRMVSGRDQVDAERYGGQRRSHADERLRWTILAIIEETVG